MIFSIDTSEQNIGIRLVFKNNFESEQCWELLESAFPSQQMILECFGQCDNAIMLLN